MFEQARRRKSLPALAGATLLVALQVMAPAWPGTAAAATLPDPTRPTAYQPTTRSVNLKLETILYSDARRVAVINGKALTEGESIGSATVLQINKDTVRLRRGDSTLRLNLQRPTIRQEP